MLELDEALGGIGGAKIHYGRWGAAGEKLVLVHPIGFDHHTWDDFANFLPAGLQAVGLDLPGHGESDKPRGADYRLRNLAARTLQFLDELGWEDAWWVGNSLGGGVCLAAAIQAPRRVKGLVLVNSVGFRWGLPLPLLGRAMALPGLNVFLRAAPRFVVRFGLDVARHGWGRVGAARTDYACRYLRDSSGSTAFVSTLRTLYGDELDQLAPYYTLIQGPKLVIHGERDPLIPVSHARRLAEVLHADLRLLPSCGHFPQEEAPRELADAVNPVLAQWMGLKET